MSQKPQSRLITDSTGQVLVEQTTDAFTNINPSQDCRKTCDPAIICSQLVPSMACDFYKINACSCKVYCNSKLQFLNSFIVETLKLQEWIKQRTSQMPATPSQVQPVMAPNPVASVTNHINNINNNNNNNIQKLQLMRQIEELLKIEDQSILFQNPQN